MKKKASKTEDAASPRYIQIARKLSREIANGRYPLGAHLPTEEELCARLDASRFTIREAVRILATGGLVRRTPRVGTIVIALPDDTRYQQSITSLRDLLQYAQTTNLRYSSLGRIRLSKEQARMVLGSAKDEWIYAVAIRHDKTKDSPICITRLYLNPDLKGIERALRRTHNAVYSLIERDFGLVIDRVEQVITGVVIDEQDAHSLGVAPGSPGLLIRRTYFDERGRVVELSENIHPASRFTYRLELRR